MSARAMALALAAIDPAAVAAPVWLHTADALACLVGARATHEGAAIAAFHSADPAAVSQAATIRYSECDAIHVPTCLTAGAIAVPVALQEAPEADAYLRAVAAGHAAGLALAHGIGGAACLARGVWPTLLAAPAIAAVTAAVARGHDAGLIGSAVALALGGASGRAGRPGGIPSGRWLAIGEATRKGLRAVEAAEAGARGDPDLLSEDWLIAQSGADLANAAALAEIDAHAVARIGLKPYVAARQGSTAIAALLALRADGLDPAQVRAIKVRLPPVTLPVITRPLDPGDRLSLIANLPLQLGLALHAPVRLLDIGREEPMPAAALEIAQRVTITADAALDEREDRWPAHLTAYTNAGPIERRTDILPGDPADAQATSMVQDKARRLGALDAAAIVGAFENGASNADLLERASALAAGCGPPLREGRSAASG